MFAVDGGFAGSGFEDSGGGDGGDAAAGGDVAVDVDEGVGGGEGVEADVAVGVEFGGDAVGDEGAGCVVDVGGGGDGGCAGVEGGEAGCGGCGDGEVDDGGGGVGGDAAASGDADFGGGAAGDLALALVFAVDGGFAGSGLEHSGRCHGHGFRWSGHTADEPPECAIRDRRRGGDDVSVRGSGDGGRREFRAHGHVDLERAVRGAAGRQPDDPQTGGGDRRSGELRSVDDREPSVGQLGDAADVAERGGELYPAGRPPGVHDVAVGEREPMERGGRAVAGRDDHVGAHDLDAAGLSVLGCCLRGEDRRGPEHGSVGALAGDHDDLVVHAAVADALAADVHELRGGDRHRAERALALEEHATGPDHRRVVLERETGAEDTGRRDRDGAVAPELYLGQNDRSVGRERARRTVGGVTLGEDRDAVAASVRRVRLARLRHLGGPDTVAERIAGHRGPLPGGDDRAVREHPDVDERDPLDRNRDLGASVSGEAEVGGSAGEIPGEGDGPVVDTDDHGPPCGVDRDRTDLVEEADGHHPVRPERGVGFAVGVSE